MLHTSPSNEYLAQELSGNPDNGFSYKGALVMIEYLDELSEDIGENIEFDAVAIRCDYSEMTLDEIVKDYFDEDDKDYINDLDDEDEIKEYTLQMLRDNTTVIEIDDDNYIIRTAF